MMALLSLEPLSLVVEPMFWHADGLQIYEIL